MGTGCAPGVRLSLWGGVTAKVQALAARVASGPRPGWLCPRCPATSAGRHGAEVTVRGRGRGKGTRSALSVKTLGDF